MNPTLKSETSKSRIYIPLFEEYSEIFITFCDVTRKNNYCKKKTSHRNSRRETAPDCSGIILKRQRYEFLHIHKAQFIVQYQCAFRQTNCNNVYSSEYTKTKFKEFGIA